MPDFRKLVTGALEAAGIKAYHGSPHRFDKFDITKIGTGEGAQAYGHGLYFAENPKVAASYEGVLPVSTDVLGAHFRTFSDRAPKNLTAADRAFAQQVIEDRMLNYGDDSLTTVADVLRHQSTFRPQNFAEVRRTLASMDERPGSMYHVNIRARPEQFLDWDKPFAQQSSQVQSILADPLSASLAKQQRARDELYARGQRASGRALSPAEMTRLATPLTPLENLSGQEMYRRVGLPAMNQAEGYGRSSAALNEMGVPGIRYLDQGSRFQPKQVEHLQGQIGQLEAMPQTPDVAKALAGRRAELDALKPTSNYVLFRDDIIDILKRYGIAAPAAATVADQSNYVQPQAQ